MSKNSSNKEFLYVVKFLYVDKQMGPQNQKIKCCILKNVMIIFSNTFLSLGEWILCNSSLSRIGIQPTTIAKSSSNYASTSKVAVLSTNQCISGGTFVGGGFIWVLPFLHSCGTWLQALHCPAYVSTFNSIKFLVIL